MTDTSSSLLEGARRKGSWLCVGLDPDASRLPHGVQVGDFLKRVIDATAPYAAAYKPNLAFFLALGGKGVPLLADVVKRARRHAPVILDAKFADIGTTAEKQAAFAFDVLGVDAVTVNPYLGRDGVAPFVANGVKLVFLLARTSNPSAGALQDLPVRGSTLHEEVVAQARGWGYPNVGFVAGATDPTALARVRKAAGEDAFLLVPGVGAQGGDAAEAIRAGGDAHAERALVNVSRQILYAGDGKDFAERAGEAARDVVTTMSAPTRG